MTHTDLADLLDRAAGALALTPPSAGRLELYANLRQAANSLRDCPKHDAPEATTSDTWCNHLFYHDCLFLPANEGTELSVHAVVAFRMGTHWYCTACVYEEDRGPHNAISPTTKEPKSVGSSQSDDPGKGPPYLSTPWTPAPDQPEPPGEGFQGKTGKSEMWTKLWRRHQDPTRDEQKLDDVCEQVLELGEHLLKLSEEHEALKRKVEGP